jgi:hypothetical protein
MERDTTRDTPEAKAPVEERRSKRPDAGVGSRRMTPLPTSHLPRRPSEGELQRLEIERRIKEEESHRDTARDTPASRGTLYGAWDTKDGGEAPPRPAAGTPSAVDERTRPTGSRSSARARLVKDRSRAESTLTLPGGRKWRGRIWTGVVVVGAAALIAFVLIVAVRDQRPDGRRPETSSRASERSTVVDPSP